MEGAKDRSIGQMLAEWRGGGHDQPEGIETDVYPSNISLQGWVNNNNPIGKRTKTDTNKYVENVYITFVIVYKKNGIN